jgi:hypothetical protein
MKIPNKIIISGIEWEVKIENHASEVDIDKRDALWGQTDHWHKVLRVLKRKESAMKVTFFHELLHALFSKTNYEKLNENDVELLAQKLYDTLERNNLLK